MASKIPPDAFEFYFGLGSGRSYRAVADHFGVTKKAITNLAVREGWQQLIEERELKIRESTDRKAVETIEQQNERHLRILKAIQAKALEALKSLSMEKAADVVRALEMSIRQERLIRGEPDGAFGISVNVTNHAMTSGPPIPNNDALGESIRRLSELARDHGLFGEEDDEP